MSYTFTRLSSMEQAEANVGKVIQYMTTDGIEYGRIVRAVPSQVVLTRLRRTAEGFEPHPEPVCPRSQNAVNFSRRIMMLEPKEVMDPVARPEEEVMDPVARPEEEVMDPVARPEAEEVIPPVASAASSRSSSRSSKGSVSASLSRYGPFLIDGEAVLVTPHHNGRVAAELDLQIKVIKTESKLLFEDQKSKAVYNSPSGLCCGLLQREGETNQWQGPAHLLCKRGGVWVSLKSLMANK